MKHVERTGILLHLVSASTEDPLATYREVRKEVEAFGHGLAEKREIVVLSKTDLLSDEERDAAMKMLAKETGREVLSVSIADDAALKAFSDRLTAIFAESD